MTYPKITTGDADDRPDDGKPLPPIAAAAARAHAPEPKHPAIGADELGTIVGRILHVPHDRPEIREDMHRLTEYIRYLERLRCEGCGNPLGYHNYTGRTLCGPCANGVEPEPEVSTRGLAYMPKVRTLNGGTLQVHESSDAEHDALWFVIGGAVIEDDALARLEGETRGAIPAASTTVDLRDAMEVARHILALGARRGYTYIDDIEEDQPEPVEAIAPASAPIIVHVPSPYPADVIDALAETAAWAARWAAEHRRADDLNEQIGWVEGIHQAYTDEHGRERCRGCIAGYDPRTGQLMHCAWPCPTERAKNGEQ